MPSHAQQVWFSLLANYLHAMSELSRLTQEPIPILSLSLLTLTMSQVYFVDDRYDPEWKVVRYKNPRSRRVTDALSEGSLSAPGQPNATRVAQRHRRPDANQDAQQSEHVSIAIVQEVMTSVETNDNAAYHEVDHEDVSDDEPPEPPLESELPSRVIEDAIDKL